MLGKKYIFFPLRVLKNSILKINKFGGRFSRDHLVKASQGCLAVQAQLGIRDA